MITLYLFAIVAANLLVAQFGPSVAVFNAFVFIAFDLTVRDRLHDRWHGRGLGWRMLALIGAGSVLSAAFNLSAIPIAIASLVAFLCAGIADLVVYEWLFKRPRLLRMNGSNVVSALVDSAVFVAIAFPDAPNKVDIILAAYAAKLAGGLVWSVVLDQWRTRTMEAVA